jgi:hypothetical protein
MANLRWLGAMVLVAAAGCSDGASSAPDASAGEQDGSVPGDASHFSDAPGASEGMAPDAGPTDVGDARPTDAGTADADDARATDAGCITGSVSFEIQGAPGAPSYCLGAAAGTCASPWLEIRPAGGGASLGLEMPCKPLCSDCQPVGCPANCGAASRLGDAGAETTWNGTYFASGTCGAGLACASPACAPAGDYIATFCGYAEPADASALGCMGSSTATCTETPFTWPPPAGSPPVRGVLGAAAADAGSCCPTGWGLSSCTYPDGGTGQQCHNPALGCASSTTCGLGCDTVVVGRCDGG